MKRIMFYTWQLLPVHMQNIIYYATEIPLFIHVASNLFNELCAFIWFVWRFVSEFHSHARYRMVPGIGAKGTGQYTLLVNWFALTSICLQK